MPFFLAPAEGFGISGLPVVAFTNIVFYYFDGYLSRCLFCDTSLFWLNMHKNSHSACMYAVFEGLIPKLWVPLNLACQDSSFGTLQRPIRQMVIEILVSN